MTGFMFVIMNGKIGVNERFFGKTYRFLLTIKFFDHQITDRII